MTDRKRNEKNRKQSLKDRLAGLDPGRVPDGLLHLARAVVGIHDPTMTCDECRTWLPAYVDAEVGGLAVGWLYPEVKRHLDLCSECEAEYLEILELALAEDAGELPVPQGVPVPDLAFLPPLALPDYVRSLAEELVAATAPDLVADLRAIVDVFFERVAVLGRRFTLGPGFAPAMGFGAGEVPEALKLLAATYAATQALTEALSPQELEAQARAGRLEATLRSQAEKAARDVGLSSQEAWGFADQYARLAGRDPDSLQDLAARRTR
jgi:hypothetical protein